MLIMLDILYILNTFQGWKWNLSHDSTLLHISTILHTWSVLCLFPVYRGEFGPQTCPELCSLPPTLAEMGDYLKTSLNYLVGLPWLLNQLKIEYKVVCKCWLVGSFLWHVNTFGNFVSENKSYRNHCQYMVNLMKILLKEVTVCKNFFHYQCLNKYQHEVMDYYKHVDLFLNTVHRTSPATRTKTCILPIISKFAANHSCSS